MNDAAKSTDQTRALLELLYAVSREVATAIDLRTVLQRVLFAAIENVGGERGSIVVLDDSGKPLDATIVYGRTFHEHTTQQLRETVERGLAGWVVRSCKPALVPDTAQDERWLRRPDDSVQHSGSKSAICVPLLARERLVGVLTLVHSIPNTFGREHLELMQAIADQAGIAVLNARLYTESQRQARVMTALAEGAVTINATLHLDDVLRRILTQTMQALQVETAALALVESVSGDLVFRAAIGKNTSDILSWRIGAGQGLTGQVIRERRGLVVPSVTQERRYTAVDRIGGIQVRALALAPIQAQGQVIGVLEAINPLAGAFDPDALLVMNGLGSLAGTTIQNALLFERLEAAHQQYHELFDDNIDPILITDYEGKVLESNRQASVLSGYEREQMQGLCIDQIHEVNWNKTGLEFENLGHDATCNYESVLHKQNGATIPIEVYVRRVQLEENKSLQWLLRDITSRKMLDSLRDDLTAMIYHDLRSPLSNIISSLDVISSMISADEREAIQPVLMVAANSTARIQRLLSSLLDTSRLESGKPVIAQKSVDPVGLVKDALHEVHLAAESRQQKVQTSFPAGLPHVWVDDDMIRRALINLLENAVKFSPMDGNIEVGGQLDGGWVRLWVQDEGPGIPSAEQERVFDKYMRLGLKSDQVSGGLGIGLAFCRLAVQSHGGRIWVESEPGHGSRFLFTLPVTKPQEAAKP